MERVARTALFGALALIALGILPAGAKAQSTPADYSRDDHWLCRPGRADACAQAQDATIVAADGSQTREAWHSDKTAPIDCFYVYPTVSNDPLGNSDFTAGPEERHLADQQFARFGSVCRTFAPMYRQITMAGLQSTMAGKPIPMDAELAYADVLAAWRYYLVHDNHGRGVVLIGHSQGTRILTRLIKEEIDDKPIERQLISALLVGFNVLVPTGKDVGGDFKTIPLCGSGSQTGCIIAYESFRAAAPPPANSRFGRTDQPGMTIACTSPAKLSGDGDTLRPYLPVGRGVFPSMAAWQASRKGSPIATRFVTVPGLVHAECRSDEHGSYLAISVAADANDPRADDIPGDIIVNGAPLADWGLHPADINLSMGNLVRIVSAQAEAYARKH